MQSTAYQQLPNEEAVRDKYTARPLGQSAKPYPIYKELPCGALLVPRDQRLSSDEPQFLTKDASSITLRDYQVEPVTRSVIALTTVSGIFINAGCGTGKTVMALAVVDRLQADSVVILVDQKDIADQWAARISEFLPNASVAVFHSKANKIETLKYDTSRFRVVVAQSLMRQDWATDPIKCDVLICDEAHVFSAPCFCSAIYNVDFRRSIALTATDDRKDGLTWVFKTFIGTTTVTVQGKTMRAKVIRPPISVDINWLDYATAWCNRDKKLTWRARCRGCPLFAKFPYACGGNLPSSDSKIQWNTDRLMWTSLLVDLCYNEDYLDKFIPVIVKFFEHSRHVLVFNQFRKPLEYMLEKTAEIIGTENCGMYVSNAKNSAAALQRNITFTTYKMSQKALDVPWKDSTILTSPVSDIRQTVGRSTRVLLGKRQPIVYDPVITNVVLLRRQAKKREKQYQDLGFE